MVRKRGQATFLCKKRDGVIFDKSLIMKENCDIREETVGKRREKVACPLFMKGG
mgnify:CR=1 FL=1